MATIIPERRPEWLKVRPPRGENYENLKQLMRSKDLHTVCEEARCPNIGECWGHKTATFMILGRVCTRSCGFCAVETGRPIGLDWEEPKRVAEAVQKMGLRHVVVTSVNRDELKGKARNLKGRVKEAWGSITGNKRTQAEGMADRAGGAAQEGIGRVKREVDNATTPEEKKR